MECSIPSEVDDTSFSGPGSPRRYGRPLNCLPASLLLPRVAGWSAATVCFDPKRKCRVNQLGPPVMPRPRSTSRCGALSRRRVVHCVGVRRNQHPPIQKQNSDRPHLPLVRLYAMAGHKLSLRTGLNLAQRLRYAKEVAAEPTTKPMSNAGHRINRGIPPLAWSRPVAAEFAAYAAAGRDDIGKASHSSLLS